MPRLREVSTSPSTSRLMDCTPSGSSVNRASKADTLSSPKTDLRSFPCTLCSTSVIPASVSAYSVFSSASSRLICSITCPASSVFRPIQAAAYKGMALSFFPPSSAYKAMVHSLRSSSSTLARIRFAFALPLCISQPECPPSRPVTSSVYQSISSELCRCIGSFECVEIPPAQLLKKIPSSSESRFNIRRPRRLDRSIASAPSMPTSSQTVKTSSNGGCGRSERSAMASI